MTPLHPDDPHGIALPTATANVIMLRHEAVASLGFSPAVAAVFFSRDTPTGTINKTWHGIRAWIMLRMHDHSSRPGYVEIAAACGFPSHTSVLGPVARLREQLTVAGIVHATHINGGRNAR